MLKLKLKQMMVKVMNLSMKSLGGAIPREYIPAVDKGIRESLEVGALAGYPVQDVKVTLYDGSCTMKLTHQKWHLKLLVQWL